MLVTLLPWLLLVALLCVAIVTDLRSRVISNRLNMAIALLSPLAWISQGFGVHEILFQIGCALALLVFFGIAFAKGMMGGGDVKLIAALGLWLPPAMILPMLFWMAIGGGLLTFACVLHHASRRRLGRPEVPYGVAIVAATFLVMTNDILTMAAT